MALEGQVALVIGGASGIGRATARELLRHGASVVLGDLQADAGEEAARQLRQEFGAGRVRFLRADVCSDADMEAAFTASKEQFKKLDIFVNAAAIIIERQWNSTIDVNIKGVIRSSLLAWKHMGKHEGGKGGAVINIASIAGLIPNPFAPIYATTKFAVVGFGRSIGMPFYVDRTGVRVFTVCPGKTDTQMLKPPYNSLLAGIEPQQTAMMNMLPMQQPENVAKAILHVIQHGDSGSVWVSENEEPAYEVAFPAYQELRVAKSLPLSPLVDTPLEGQVALVVGGAGGIGRATARELLRQGASVALGDVSADASEEAARQLRQEFGAARVSFLRADVCSDADMEAAFAATKEQFKRLDVFVNAAGIFNDREWSLSLDVNAKGAVRGSLLAWKHMGKHEGGSGGIVVNISSILGLFAAQTHPIYVASKFGVVGLGASLGMQFNVELTGVRLFTICPGRTDTAILHKPYKTLFEDASGCLAELAKHFPIQQPEHLAKEILRVIQHGDSGSVWVCENDEPAYEVALPAYQELRVTKPSPKEELAHEG